PNYTGSDSGSLVIAKATAGVVVDSLNVLYDGQPKPVGVTTNPSGLTTQVTYDGLEEAPSAVGSYAVVVVIDDTNYEGTANELLTIEASLDSWRESFGLVSADPFADEDGDGWFAVAEYLYDTDPTNGTSSPSMVPMLDATTFSLVTPPPVDRPDASVVGEVSSGLSQWTSDGVTDTGTGFSVPRSEPSRFLRLRFSYDSGE
ncbi:MAG: MBG domain-containing protein, partial [Haloferula sp.]